MQSDKYALLDTDFISKMHIIQKDEKNHLIDRVMELPGYRFFCHSQIRKELSRHNISGSMEWLENKICTGQIKCYSDKEILDELESVYGGMAVALYVDSLKNACSAYAADYFTNNFRELQRIDSIRITKVDFLENLRIDCDNIGVCMNLGEIKTCVLFQLFLRMCGENVYVFCSDDKNARSGIVNIGSIRCISVLSSFMRLKKELDFGLEDAKEYISSWLSFCAGHKQTTFKVLENSRVPRMCKVPCEQLMREIYEDKLEETRIGYLRYKSEAKENGCRKIMIW